MVSVTSVSSGSLHSTTINKNQRTANSALEKLASGKSINRASDNASGLAIATSLLSDVTTLKQASTNTVQASSVLQTADGGLQQTGDILDRMKSLATQANSGSLDANARSNINTEYQSLLGELNGVASSTNFNGTQLLNGSYNQNFQTGTSGTDTVNVDLSSVDASASGLGLSAANGANANALSTQGSAAATSNELDAAISSLSSYRSQVGALQSNVTTQGNVIDTQAENLTSAASAISDADIAQEQTNFTNSKALSELSIAAAAQGNKLKSSLLKLVR